MIRDTSNINLIRAVGYGPSEVVTLDHGIATLTQLRKARQILADTTQSMVARRQAADLLIVSPYSDDRDLADGYIGMWAAQRRRAAFATLNDGTMKRDTLEDLAATAGRWFLWGLAAATAAMMISMAYDLALDLPGVIARAAQ